MPKSRSVDVVITWVDSNDPHYFRRLQAHSQLHGKKHVLSSQLTRYRSCGELAYCLRSIMHFMPWVRFIHVVTDAQIPAVFSTIADSAWCDRIKQVDHRVLFRGYEGSLPTFNSISIESMLWRIPDLSSQFIYFNDDCFVIRPTNYDDFFVNDQPVLRGYWRLLNEKRRFNRLFLAYRTMFSRALLGENVDIHRVVQENSARRVGMTRCFFNLDHVPFPLLKQTFIDYFDQHPDALSANIAYPFRDSAQFLPVSLAYHLNLQDSHPTIDTALHSISVNPSFHHWSLIKKRLAQVKRDGIRFVCMQSLDEASLAQRDFIYQWLDEHIPAFMLSSTARH